MLDETSESRTAEERPPQERSIGELFGDLARELSALVRHEIQLAKVEMGQKVSQAGRNVGLVATGGTLAQAGLLAVIAGIILALGAIIPLWLSAVLVGVIVLAAGAGLAKKNLDELKRLDPAPRQTLETLKEDARWAREQAQ